MKSAIALNARPAYTLSAKPVVHQASRRQAAIARLAVQLAREDAGQYMTPQEIARHAATLVGAAYAARSALATRKSPKPHYRAARQVADTFGAELVNRGDLNGLVVGLRFASGRYTSGAENILFVS